MSCLSQYVNSDDINSSSLDTAMALVQASPVMM